MTRFYKTAGNLTLKKNKSEKVFHERISKSEYAHSFKFIGQYKQTKNGLQIAARKAFEK